MKDKLLTIVNKITDNKKRAVAWLLVVCMILGVSPLSTLTVSAEAEYKGTSMVEENTGDMNRVPYNNDGLIVNTGYGTFAGVAIADMNDDGYLDLLTGSYAADNKSTAIYYGSGDSQNPESEQYLLMTEPLAIDTLGAQPNGSCIYEYDEATHKYGDYVSTLLTNYSTAKGDATSWPNNSSGYGYELPGSDSNFKNNETNKTAHQTALANANETTAFKDAGGSYTYVDYDGDGYLDLIWSATDNEDNKWTYGLDTHYYNQNGVWDTNGDGEVDHENGWIFWYKNKGDESNQKTAYDYSTPQVVVVYDWEYDAKGNKKIIESSMEALDVKGSHHAQIKDWDNDGDLDIICTSFINEITYFENIGTRKEPIYLKGREILTDEGNVWENTYAMTFATSADWNKDGYMDWIGTSENHQIYLVENTGKVSEDNTPIFKEAQFFRQPAASLKIDSESPIYSIDWDGDGDEDILTGDAHGFLSLIKNVTVEKGGDFSNPSWEERVFFTNPDGEVYRILGGLNGSYQGPQEYCYGYTCISVADWDGDGVLDVMSNNIWGKVFWHRGIKGELYQLEDARPVEVEWNDDDGDGVGDPKYPSEYIWWQPEGNELATLWRTNPFMIDLNDDGLMDLVMMDYEGYLAYYERYESADGTLKLKEGERIFKTATGADLQLRSGKYGMSGRVKFTLADWNDDGKIDLIYENNLNAAYAENVALKDGEYWFNYPGELMHSRNIYYHSMSPTTCDWDRDGLRDLLITSEGGCVYYLKNNHDKLDASTQQEVTKDYITLDGFDMISVNDFEDANGNTMASTTYSDGTYFKLKNDESFDKKLLSLRLDYTTSGWSDETIRLFANDAQGTHSFQLTPRSEAKFTIITTTWENNVVYPGGSLEDMDAETAKVTSFLDEFVLQISIEYVTYDEQGTNNDLKLGFYFNGNFYGNYFYYPNCNIDNITNYMVLYRPQGIKISNVGETEGLVAHWDFEESGDGVLADKADMGTIADTLTEVEQSTGTVEVEDGVAILKGQSALKAADSADLDITGKMTLFARVKIEGSYSSNGPLSAAIMDKATWTQKGDIYAYTLGTYWTGFDENGDKNHAVALNMTLNSSGKENINANNQSGRTIGDEWREIALVVDKNSDGYLTYELLISKNEATADGADFVSHYKKAVPYTEHVANNASLYIGNEWRMYDSIATRYFDDVRIYNKALTAEELAAIITPAASDNTSSYYLTDLENDAYISFSPSRTSYKKTTNATTISLKPVADDTSAVIKVNENVVTSDVANTYDLSVGTNTFTITLGDGTNTYRTYQLTITREGIISTSDLQTEINAAKEITQGDYTNTSYAYLQVAINDAQTVVNTEGVTEDALSAASEKLQNAIRDLTSEMRVTDLEALVEEVTSLGLQNTGYKYWDEYQTQLTKAKELMASTVPYTEDIETTYTALSDAYDKLFSEDDLPVSLEGFRHATLSSNGMADKQYTSGTSATIVHLQSEANTDLDHTLLSFKMKFSKTGYANNRIDLLGSIFMLYPATENTLRLHTLTNYTDGSWEEIDVSEETSSIYEEFLLQIAFEYLDEVQDDENIDDSIQMKVFVNGKDVYNKILGVADFSKLKNEILLASVSETYPITLKSVVPENKSLTELTWSDYKNASTGTQAENGTFSSQDVVGFELRNENIKNMSSTSFQAKIKLGVAFSGGDNMIRFGGKANQYGLFIGANAQGKLYMQTNNDLFANINKSVWVEPSVAGVDSFYNQEFVLKITTEFADFDGDGDENDVQLGYYINGKLYNNQYLYAYDCKDSFGPWLSVHATTGGITIKSVPELIYHKLTDGAYTLEKGAGWINGVATDATTLAILGDHEIAMGNKDNVVTLAVLYNVGDAHVDGQYDVRDLVATMKASEGIALKSKAATKAADADEKDNVDAEDVTTVRNMLIQ